MYIKDDTFRVVRLLELSAPLLQELYEHGIRIDDYRFTKAYREYMVMRSNRVKHHTAVVTVAEDVNVSERTMERILKRLSGIVKS